MENRMPKLCSEEYRSLHALCLVEMTGKGLIGMTMLLLRDQGRREVGVEVKRGIG